MGRKTVSVGVDVDSLAHYYRIHGLDEISATNAVWRVGVPRFVELFEEVGVPATFYCIAEDLERAGNPERLRAVAEAGHEIGNHTWHHRYDLARLPDAERRAEVATGRRLLEEAAGVPVVGFRGPGYAVSAALQEDLRLTGHRYDSSLFPCVPYYAAKAAVMGTMALRGLTSQSVLASPRVLLAPRTPYLADRFDPLKRGAHGLPQYPVSVVSGVPLIGTAFTALGAKASLAAALTGLFAFGHLTLEFHGVDLLSLVDDGLDPVLSVQPDLKASVKRKRVIFKEILEALARRAQVVRLDELALTPPR